MNSMIKLYMMNSLDSVSLYVFLAFLAVAIVSFFIIRAVKRAAAKIGKNSSYYVLLKGCVLTVFMYAFSSLVAAVFRMSAAMPIILFFDILFLVIYTKKSFSRFVEELNNAEKQKRETDAYIVKLKNAPAEELKKIEKLVSISRGFLNKTSSVLYQRKDLSTEMYGFTIQTLVDYIAADGAVLVLADYFDEILKVKTLFGKFAPPYKLPDDVPHKEERVNTNFKYAEFPLEGSLFGKIVKDAKTLLIKNGNESDLLAKNGEEPFLRHGSLIFLPLISDGKSIGLIAVSRLPEKTPFNNQDARMAESLAGYIAEIVNLAVSINESSESAEIENISETAAKIQKILLPKNLKKHKYMDIGEYFLPVRGICSDYYDVITQNNRSFAIVADVAGKSVHAAIVMVMIRAILYLITNTNQSASAILDWLNKGITGKIEIDHFASISILCFEPKKNIVEFIGAGNQSIMLWRKKTKKIELFQQKSDPIGVDLKSVYMTKDINFDEGDIIAVYTDGLVESVDSLGEQYGIKRLAGIIAENNNAFSKDIAAKVKDDVISFIGKGRPRDDHTLLIIKKK